VGDRFSKSVLFEQFARVGKALASGKRLELLDLLAQGERTVDQLARAADLGVTSASSHLQVLKQANLVSTRRDGTRIFYALAGDDVVVLFDQLRRVAQEHISDVELARLCYLGIDSNDPGEEIGRKELLARARAGDVVVLDVRPAAEFRAGHLPDAISLPLEELTARLEELPVDTEIVAYCRGAYCVMAYEAVQELTKQGRRALRLADGFLEWRLDGLPIEIGA
jgi:rhodanese-related sulfurtransferase